MAEAHKLPTSNNWVSLALFTNVSNSSKLRSDAVSGRIQAILLDPTLVCVPPLIELAALYTVYQ